MTQQKEFPLSPEEVTLEWLCRVLQDTGLINNSKVKSFESEKILIEFTGELIRFKLEYTGEEKKLPTSLIAKFSNRDEEKRNHFKEGYEKEVRFYQEFAPISKLPTPRCYYGNIDLKTGYSLLLLEDLGHLRTLDIETGCTLTEIERCLRHLAEFHAQWSDHPKLQESSYIRPLDQLFKSNHQDFQRRWPQVPTKLKALLPEYQLPKNFLKLGDRFCQNKGDLFKSLCQSPITLVHLDIHLDNMFLWVEENGVSPLFFDWQTYGYGRGIIDVTYFIIDALSNSLRRQEEEKLIKGYHHRLIQNGIQGYTFEQCWNDYRLAVFWKLMNLTIGILIDDLPPEMLPMLRAYVENALTRIITFNEDHNLEEFL